MGKAWCVSFILIALTIFFHSSITSCFHSAAFFVTKKSYFLQWWRPLPYIWAWGKIKGSFCRWTSYHQVPRPHKHCSAGLICWHCCLLSVSCSSEWTFSPHNCLLLLGGIFNSHIAFRCSRWQGTWEEVWMGMFLVYLTFTWINLNCLHWLTYCFLVFMY